MLTQTILDIKQFPEGFFMQRHEPEVMQDNHAHSHVEILLPVGCDLTYLTQMGPVIAKLSATTSTSIQLVVRVISVLVVVFV